mmetsp:Transcript_7873/g.19327  ORF Transcript_7873/g.19327 Transcript_7873/m.19327 type:complete len:227 (-) Transcript_7873:552-1232(-)
MAQKSRKSPVWAASHAVGSNCEAKRQKTDSDDDGCMQRALRKIAAVRLHPSPRTLVAACDTQEVQRVAGDGCAVATDPTALWIDHGESGLQRFSGLDGKDAALCWLGAGCVVRGWIIGTSESSALVRVVALKRHTATKREDEELGRLRGRDSIVRGRLPLSQVVDGVADHSALLGLPIVAEVTQVSVGKWDCELSLLRRVRDRCEVCRQQNDRRKDMALACWQQLI